MAIESVDELKTKKCQPCEGGVPPVGVAEAERLLRDLRGWQLRSDRKGIRRAWVVEDFMAAIEFFDRVAELAEQEQHHPDLYLTGYRNVAIELSTHAIDGLSENDFIVAAKINELPVQLRK
jgi:4a-hydroxytetrahydrobiopterin dehydratase